MAIGNSFFFCFVLSLVCVLSTDAATLGQVCNATITCTGDHVVCSDTNTCVCGTSYQQNSAGNACFVGLSSQCPNPASDKCLDPNAVCTNKSTVFTCLCNSSYYNNGGTCVLKVALGEACPTGTTEACLDTNATCTGTCTCKSTHYNNNGKCEPKKSLGYTCSPSLLVVQCADTNAECVGSSDTGTCQCKAGFYDSNGESLDGMCVAKVGLDSACPQPDACFTPNAVCSTLNGEGTCVCGIGYYDNNGNITLGGNCSTKVGLGEVCPRQDACSTPNSMCSNINGGGTCICSSVYYDDNGDILGGNCLQKVQLGTPCTMPTACATANSGCVGGTCQCSSGYYDDTGANLGGNCQNRLILNNQCDNFAINNYGQRDQCQDGNAACKFHNSYGAYSCTCKEGYHPEGSTCVEDKPLGVSCTYKTDCSDPNADCIGSKCTCGIRYYDSNGRVDGGNCMPTVGLGEGCPRPDACGTPNSMCSNIYGGGTCVCSSVYYDDNGNILGGNCLQRSGEPTNLTVTGVTSRSMNVAWSYPERTNSEEILGYVLQIKNNSSSCVHEQLFKCQDCISSFQDPVGVLCPVDVRQADIFVSKQQLKERQVYNVTGLLPDIEYTLSVSAVTSTGQGNISFLVHKSDEEEPQMPTDVSATDILEKSMIVIWKLQGPRPGLTNFTVTLTADAPASSPNKTVEGFDKDHLVMDKLEENWTYGVSVTAITSKGSKIAHSAAKYTTKPAAPGPVDKFTVVTPGLNYTALQVKWMIPAILERNSKITGYVFVHNVTGTEIPKDVGFVSESHIHKEIVTVVPGNYYFFKVYAKNQEGKNGAERTIYMQAPAGGIESNQGDAPIGPIVGGVIGGIFVLAVIGATVGFVIYRKRILGPNSLCKLWKHESLNNGYNEDRLDTPRKRPVKLSEFPTYVADMHEELNLKFSLSFEDLKAVSLNHKQSVATETKNQMKNRDMHVLPYDHSRVVLRSEHGMDDYINASFLPGYRSAREYIGCQGPLPGTVDDFWRMVWEQNVSAVVMLTLCQEHNEVKCEQYWPSVINEPKQFGDVEVQLISSSSFANYNHNVMKLVCNGRPRILEHFQFLSWRNMTTNDALIDFITQVRKHVQPPDTAGPMIVHCSNGAGRTGIYIMLDHLMQFIDDHDFGSSIDIFGMVLKLQENRPNIVQTLHQYEFIHDCINTILARKDTASSQGNTYETIKSSERYAYQNQQEHAYEMLKLN